MGEIRPGDGAHSDDLPALPPEWGAVVVPDDASELADEAEAVRLELRERSADHDPLPRPARPDPGRPDPDWSDPGRPDPGRSDPGRSPGWPESRRAGRPANARPQVWPPREPPSLATPIWIMLIAMLATLISVAVATLGRPGPGRPPSAQAPSVVRDAGPGATAPAATLAEVTLTDPTGAPVRLGALLPAVVLLTDGCSCAALVLDVARAAPAGVTVIALATAPPVIYGAPTHVRTLAAAKDSPLRTRYAAGVSAPGDAATVIIIDGPGAVLAVLPAAETVADIEPLFGALAPPMRRTTRPVARG